MRTNFKLKYVNAQTRHIRPTPIQTMEYMRLLLAVVWLSCALATKVYTTEFKLTTDRQIVDIVDAVQSFLQSIGAPYQNVTVVPLIH